MTPQGGRIKLARILHDDYWPYLEQKEKRTSVLRTLKARIKGTHVSVSVSSVCRSFFPLSLLGNEACLIDVCKCIHVDCTSVPWINMPGLPPITMFFWGGLNQSLAWRKRTTITGQLAQQTWTTKFPFSITAKRCDCKVTLIHAVSKAKRKAMN